MFTCGHEVEAKKATEYKKAIENAKPIITNSGINYDNGISFNNLPLYQVDVLTIDEFIFIMKNQRKNKNV